MAFAKARRAVIKKPFWINSQPSLRSAKFIAQDSLNKATA